MIRAATEADAGALARLLFRNPQVGRLLLGQDRQHDFFARSRVFGEAATLVVDGHHGPDATVTVARKDVVLAGQPAVAGYVFDLAVDGPARGRGLASRLLAAAEAWAAERDAGLLYANIIGGNQLSRLVFRQAGYQLHVPMGLRLFPIFRPRPAPGTGAPSLLGRVLDAEAAAPDLAPVEDGPARWRSLPGWRDEDVWAADGAVLALWDHRAVTRPIPLGLPAELRALGAVSGVVRRLRIPFPRAPELGTPIGVGYLLGGVGPEAALRRLLLAGLARAHQRGLDVVAVPYQLDRRPGWAGGAFNTGERYDLVARALQPGPGETLGSRPVHADAADL